MDWISDITPFAFEYVRKEAFWLFLIIPCLVVWYWYNQKKTFQQINISSTTNFRNDKWNWAAFIKHLNFSFFLIGLMFVILAMARPHTEQDIDEYNKKNIEGIDIVISMDVSGSMLAGDIKPNRLEAAKEVASNFIDDRPTDRIGLVVYEGDAFTKSPLTTDHDLLKAQLEKVQTGMVVGGTAIGLGLITATNRLLESDAKSKVIILMTDGMNNSGDMPPEKAAHIAKEMGICVYTVGMGKEGGGSMNIFGGFASIGSDLDEVLLTDIANLTGGKYFRAQSKTELQNIYDEIDQMEKAKVKVLDFKVSPPERFYGFLLLGLTLIMLNKILNTTLLKSIP